MDKGEKKPSTYAALKSLDAVVQKDKKKEYSDSSSSYKKKRANSPRRTPPRRTPPRRTPPRRSSPRRSSPRRSSPRRTSPRRNSPNRRGNNKKEKIEVIKIEEDIDFDIPDRSFGDLYCKACDSHMNSELMWDAHIRGKRHLKQIKRSDPGDHKYEKVDEDPIILPEIKNVKEPIVGLQHCCEIQRSEGKPTYQCFLCSASIATSELLIEHVIGLKHRMAYLKEYDSVNYHVIIKADLKKGMIEPVVEEYVQKLEDERGPGKMPVKLEKPKPKETWGPVHPDKKAPAYSNRKRPYQDDLDYKSSGRRDSYDGGRNDDRYDDKYDDKYDDWRAIPDRTRDYPRNFPSNDKYSELPPENSMWQHDLYEKNEALFSRRRSLTPPLSELSYARSSIDSKPRDTNSLWSTPDQSSSLVDLRHILDKRRMLDESAKASQTAPAPNLFESLVGIIEDLPNMMFLELVLHKVQNMNPTDTELDMLRKIGDYMFALVMNKRMEKLPPDLISKYQEKVTSSAVSTSNSIYINPAAISKNSGNTSSATAIQNLLDLFKNQGHKNETSSANQNIASQPVYSSAVKDATFSTQSTSSLFYNLWGTGASSTPQESSAIPGLTLSASQEMSSDNRYSYPQNQPDDRYAQMQSVYSPNQYPDIYNRR